MRVLHLSRSDWSDSASRSALAIHRRLREIGVDSRMLVANQGSQEPSVLAVKPCREGEAPAGPISFSNAAQSAGIREATEVAITNTNGSDGASPSQGVSPSRTSETETYRNAQSFCFDFRPNSSSSSAFELGYPGVDLSAHPEVLAADVIHLHQVAGVISPQCVGALLALGKPVIWSLPDRWPFTGGCFHSNQCEGFRKGCADCPQLAQDEFSLPAALLADKRAWFSASNLSVLVPGADLAQAASDSCVFQNATVESLAIPFGGTSFFKGREGSADGQVDELRILFVCESRSPIAEPQLAELLTYAQTYGAFRGLVRRGKVRLAVSGISKLPGIDLPVEFLPDLDFRAEACELFQADLLVFAAIQENRPALLFEALENHVPVLTEPQAGLGQWVADRTNGWISKRPGVKALAESLAYLAANPGVVRQLSKGCQPAGAEAFCQAIQKLVALYQQAAQRRSRNAPTNGASPVSTVLDKCKAVEHAIATRHVRDFIGSDLLRDFQQSQRMGKSMESLLAETQQSLVAIERRQKEVQEALGKKPPKSLAQAQKAVAQLRNKLKLRLRRIRATESSRDKLPKRPGPGVSGLEPVEIPRVSWLARLAAKALTPSGQKPSFKTQLGKPVPIQPEQFPKLKIADDGLPRIALVTPSFMQGDFLEKTIRSVLDQNYPNLVYAVQDGGSGDRSVEVIKQFADRITVWASEPDSGQTRAILSGFEKISGKIMGWLNSDDLLMPGALRFIGDYFASHPEVDAIYGNRVLINEHDLEFARWILPAHNRQLTRLIDPVPQETFFWRASFWEKVGGLDPGFRFAMDWDFILRLQNAGANIVHVPYFLGCFRVHSLQKTSAQMECLGAEEMASLRWREHGRFFEHEELQPAQEWLDTHGAIRAGLMRFGIR